MPAAKKKSAHDKVMDFVERELKKNPEIKSGDLLVKAKKVSRSVSSMSVRQFHAKYPLQVKKRIAHADPRRRAARKKKSAKAKATRPVSRSVARGADRDEVRAIMLSFAKELSTAEGKAGAIDVMLSLDGYVDRVIKAVE